MKLAMICAIALAACTATATEDPAERPVSELELAAPTTGTVAAWKCGGDKLYFNWVCDTTVGQWTKDYVADEYWNCGYPAVHTIDGPRTACHESIKYACGGGDDESCNLDDTCTFPPVAPCHRAVPSCCPGPCCVGP